MNRYRMPSFSHRHYQTSVTRTCPKKLVLTCLDDIDSSSIMTHPRVSESPPFEEALSVFRRFLRRQGVSDNMRWLWRDAIISRRGPGARKSASRRIFIDRQKLADQDSVREYYDRGVERGLGIALRVFCLAEGIPLCYIYVPEDETAAGYAMMSALKCSIPTPCPKATFINHWTIATIMRLFLRIPRSSWGHNEIPIRPVHL